MPTVLVLTAHGDDMEFFAGGTIAKLCGMGYDVHLVIATDNARGTFELTAEQMFGLRMREAEAAAKVLGLKSVSCLDYPDGGLSDTPLNVLRGQFMGFIRGLRPDIVFTFDPWAPYEGHQDHRAVSWAAMEAASFSHFPLYYPEQVAAGIQPWQVGEVYYFAKSPRDVNKHVDISGEFLEKKIEALYCFDSQMVLTLADAQMQINTAPYDVPEITSLDPHDYRAYIDQTVRRTAAIIGKRYGVEYAEHFRRTRWGGSERLLSEPVVDPF
ncbi:MAG TPA: PIG-L deacetylase family protein [Tepidiformaceae bacterium]|nr:PIG-L deacetylase family protein [Tepidiformaceae bacterium]